MNDNEGVDWWVNRRANEIIVFYKTRNQPPSTTWLRQKLAVSTSPTEIYNIKAELTRREIKNVKTRENHKIMGLP
jgi:hypothetical protein